MKTKYPQIKLTPEQETEGYKYVRAAIIEQAVYDYRKALVNCHLTTVFLLEKWFLSDWGQALSENNGDKIIKRVRAECGKRHKRNLKG